MDRDDVGLVAQPAQGAGLVLNAGTTLGGQPLRIDLGEGGVAVEGGVVDTVDGLGLAGAEASDDPVAAVGESHLRRSPNRRPPARCGIGDR